MKILTSKKTLEVLGVFEDTEFVLLDNVKLTTIGGADYSRNKENCILWTNIKVVPTNTIIGKYFFNGNAFLLNPNYIK